MMEFKLDAEVENVEVEDAEVEDAIGRNEDAALSPQGEQNEPNFD